MRCRIKDFVVRAECVGIVWLLRLPNRHAASFGNNVSRLMAVAHLSCAGIIQKREIRCHANPISSISSSGLNVLLRLLALRPVFLLGILVSCVVGLISFWTFFASDSIFCNFSATLIG